MASLGRKSKERPKPVMNVTPLVDVVLVLLIIFMIVIPAMQQGMNIEIPTMLNTDEDRDGPDPFTLSVTRDGTLFFELEPLPREAREQRLRDANTRDPRRKLVIRGDRAVRYEQARELMAIAQAIGFPGASIRVGRQPSTPQEEN